MNFWLFLNKTGEMWEWRYHFSQFLVVHLSFWSIRVMFFGSTLFNQHLQYHPSWSYFQIIFIMTLKVAFNISPSALDAMATMQFLLRYNRKTSVGSTVKQSFNWICELEACYPPPHACWATTPIMPRQSFFFFFFVKTGTKDKTAWHSWNGTHPHTAIITCSPLSGALSLRVYNWFRGQAIKIDVSLLRLRHQESRSGIMWRKTPAYYRGTIKYL